MIIMNQRRTITKEDSRTLWGYLFYAFALAWGTEFIMIAVYHFNLLSGGAALFFHFTILGCFKSFPIEIFLSGTNLKMIFYNAGIYFGHRTLAFCANRYGIPISFDKKILFVKTCWGQNSGIHAIYKPFIAARLA